MTDVEYDRAQLDQIIRSLETIEKPIGEALQQFGDDVVAATKSEARKHRRTGALERGIRNDGLRRRRGDLYGSVTIRRRRGNQDITKIINARTGFYDRAIRKARRLLRARAEAALTAHTRR